MAISRDGYNYQLFKKYSLGSISVYRPITRPIDNIFFHIDTAEPFVMDWDKGRFSFANPQPLILNWTGSFYVPCRFELDFEDKTEQKDKWFSISRLELNEVREEPLFYQTYTLPESLDHSYQLYNPVDSRTTREYMPLITTFDSGWEVRREQLKEKPVLRFITRERKINYSSHIEYIIALWRITRGGAIAINYEDKLVQGRGELTLTNTSPTNFSIAPLEFVQPEADKLLTVPDLPDFLVNLIEFDISEFEGLTPNHIDVSTEGYESYGGGGSGGGSGGSGGSSGGSGFTGSFGSTGVSFNNEPGLTGVYPFFPQQMGEFNGIPFGVGWVQLGFGNSSPKQLCFAYMSDPNGTFTVQRIGTYDVESYNGGRIQELIHKNGKFVTIIAVTDSTDSSKHSLCLEVHSDFSFSWTTSPVVGSGNFLTSPGFYVDDNYIHVYTSPSGTYRFADFASPSGDLIVTENTQQNVLYKSGISSGNNLYPAALSGDSGYLTEVGDKKAYLNALKLIDDGGDLISQKALADPVNDFEEIHRFPATNFSYRFGIHDSVQTLSDIVIAQADNLTDHTFPHQNLTTTDTASNFTFVFKRTSDSWELYGSWNNQDLEAIGTISQIFSSPRYLSVLFKGIHLNSAKWVKDLNTGAINTLDNIIPGFPFTAIASISASPNYIIFYGNVGSQPSIGMLAINN